ncbi:uncharacterized protein LOC111864096 isoform X2 [Cryptotermes secundus]|uniref:uncharacterized protein LOC111864096 isoform X2 n=1 Tax=Cryptotermes secundus TaxID=105785 RepID=UPI000CD7C55F|nr:uncharacterized protein LOC111864096 isoform X2 [Cryptotermes secundus]
MHNPQTIMCDEQFLNPHKFPHSATRVPKMIVQRVEEIFPALKESLEKTTVKVEDDVDVQSEEDSIDMKSHKDYVPAVLSEEKTDPEISSTRASPGNINSNIFWPVNMVVAVINCMVTMVGEDRLTGCKPEGPEGLEDTEVNSSLLQEVNTLEESLPPGSWKEQLLNPVGGSFHQRPLLNPEGQPR